METFAGESRTFSLVAVAAFALAKAHKLQRLLDESLGFHETFWGGAVMTELYSTVCAARFTGGLPAVFVAGFSHLASKPHENSLRARVAHCCRAVRHERDRELDRIRGGLRFLQGMPRWIIPVGIAGSLLALLRDPTAGGVDWLAPAAAGFSAAAVAAAAHQVLAGLEQSLAALVVRFSEDLQDIFSTEIQ